MRAPWRLSPLPARRVGALLGAVGLLLAGGGTAAGVVLGLAPATPAGADPIGDCSTSAGVLVVVDFGHWGGPADVGCAAASGTGSSAMAAAGFITAGTQEEGPAFVCRIGLATEGPASLEPTPSEDPCVNTPPVSAYWSYWHADAGQDRWSYSQQGVMSYRPPPGSIDAWTFGATDVSGSTGQPPFSPDQVRAAALSGGSGSIALAPGAGTAPTTPTAPGSGTTSAPVTPAASRPSTTPATTGVTGAGATGVGGSAAGSVAPGGPGSAATPPQPGTGASVGPRAPGRRSDPTFQIVASAAGPAVARRGSSGPPATFVGALATIALVAGVGGVVAWRRRRSG